MTLFCNHRFTSSSLYYNVYGFLNQSFFIIFIQKQSNLTLILNVFSHMCRLRMLLTKKEAIQSTYIVDCIASFVIKSDIVSNVTFLELRCSTFSIFKL